MLYHKTEHSRVSLTFSEGAGHLSCKLQACNVHMPVECTVHARDYVLHVHIHVDATTIRPKVDVIPSCCDKVSVALG